MSQQQRAYKILQQQVQQLLREHHGTRDTELSAKTCEEVYQLSDGRVLMNVADLSGWVFASREEMLAHLEQEKIPASVEGIAPSPLPTQRPCNTPSCDNDLVAKEDDYFVEDDDELFAEEDGYFAEDD